MSSYFIIILLSIIYGYIDRLIIKSIKRKKKLKKNVVYVAAAVLVLIENEEKRIKLPTSCYLSFIQ